MRCTNTHTHAWLFIHKHTVHIAFYILHVSFFGFHSHFQSQTHTYLWLFTCHWGQRVMINLAVIFIPLHHLSVIMGETANDSRVRLNWSVLHCNLNVAFLGSPLSVSPLLPWLPLKSLLCPFVAKLLVFPPAASLCVMTQALTWGKCRHSLHKLSEFYSDTSHGV